MYIPVSLTQVRETGIALIRLITHMTTNTGRETVYWYTVPYMPSLLHKVSKYTTPQDFADYKLHSAHP